jgi:hypothetical protein
MAGIQFMGEWREAVLAAPETAEEELSRTAR